MYGLALITDKWHSWSNTVGVVGHCPSHHSLIAHNLGQLWFDRQSSFAILHHHTCWTRKVRAAFWTAVLDKGNLKETLIKNNLFGSEGEPSPGQNAFEELSKRKNKAGVGSSTYYEYVTNKMVIAAMVKRISNLYVECENDVLSAQAGQHELLKSIFEVTTQPGASHFFGVQFQELIETCETFARLGTQTMPTQLFFICDRPSLPPNSCFRGRCCLYNSCDRHIHTLCHLRNSEYMALTISNQATAIGFGPLLPWTMWLYLFSFILPAIFSLVAT